MSALRKSTRLPADSAITAMGLTFPGPLGLAAGFDKDALGPEALGALGFSFVEVGTLTPLPQNGNPKPRLFRLSHDRALINRMGFNNNGIDAAVARLKARKGPVIVGVNIGKNMLTPTDEAIVDYCLAARAAAEVADYVVVNVSSPNTPGLRSLQGTETLRPLLEAVRKTLDEASDRHVPLLVKIAPDLADKDIVDIADLSLSLGIDGIIATNTTLSREDLQTDAETIASCGSGGISGPPLAAKALHVLRLLSGHLGEDSPVTLISVGGIETGEDIEERLAAGARLVQGYTGLIYAGPCWPHRIQRITAKKPIERA